MVIGPERRDGHPVQWLMIKSCCLGASFALALSLASVVVLGGCASRLGVAGEPLNSPEAATPQGSAAQAAASVGGGAEPGASRPAKSDPAPPTATEAPRIFPGTGAFLNTKPPAPPKGPLPEEASLNFEALDVRSVAKVILGDYLRESYTVHPAVSGTVTFRTVRPIPRSALLLTLEMLLRQNNAALVNENGIYKIVPVTAVRGSVSPQLGGSSRALPAGYSVLVVPVRFVGAKEMAKLLEPFAPEGSVRIDEVRNLVVLAGSQNELRHLLDTIELFDVDWLSGYSVGMFPVRSIDVKTLVSELDKVFGATGAGPLAGAVRVVPIERLNSILVVTTQPRYLDTARVWLERLDQVGGMAGGARLFVYSVRNGKAENLAALLGELFSRGRTTPAAPQLAPGARPAQIASPAPTPAPGMPAQLAAPAAAAQPAAPVGAVAIPSGAGVSSDVRVIADKDNNALLVLGTAADYEIIEAALLKLDVLPRQVLVSVTVAEVTLTDDLKFGVDWFLTGRSVGESSVTSGTVNLGGLPATPAGAVPAFTGLQLINRLGGDVRGVLNALGKDGRLQVLATPQLMVLDNQKAQIKIGDRISVQTQQQSVAGTTAGIINSFQYLETGILLSVTPRINSGGQVTLEVSQEVSVPVASSVPGANPDISQRTATTSVVVASGESIVLGGLIREDNTRATAGVPLLSKIPVLGAAFGTQNIVRRRTETILLIRPVVLTSPAAAAQATEELRRRMPALEQALTPSSPGVKPSPVK